MRRLTCFALLALALMPGAAVAASGTVAPPGNSGVDEYQESVPTATGNKPSSGAATAKPDGAALSAAAQRRLDALGADGQAAAQLAEQTAPDEVRQRTKKAAPAVKVDERTPHASANLSDALSQAAGGSGGMGAALPALLVVTVLGGAGWLILHRRAT